MGGLAGRLSGSRSGSVERATDLLLDGSQARDGLLVRQPGGDRPVGARSADVAGEEDLGCEQDPAPVFGCQGLARAQGVAQLASFALPQVGAVSNE